MRTARAWAAVLVLGLASGAWAQRQDRAPEPGPNAGFSLILGRPTASTVTLSVLSSAGAEARLEFRTLDAEPQDRGTSAEKTESAGKAPVAERPWRTAGTKKLAAGVPTELEVADLAPDTVYEYRVRTREGAGEFADRERGAFRTARPAGATFTFGVQGDSHPERLGRMYDPALYRRTLENVAKDAPDFYVLMGDDFSIERLIERNTRSQKAVDAVYAHQRGFLGIVGKSTPLMLVNGNHEQAAKYLLDGTANNFAVFAGKARTTFYPLPAPNSFYTGNTVPVEHVGLLRDYYAWTWGDALFVVIDPYWHSDVAVDNEAGAKGPARDASGEPAGKSTDDAKTGEAKTGEGKSGEGKARGGGRGQRDLWQITLGDRQYQWLRETLGASKAKFKFVFSHHVMGTGRGGVEMATMYEWGGNDRRGVDRFAQMRPTWTQPIHDLMRDTGVTIFFQGHDHLYARQELEGVVYQTCPNPADPTFTAFNRQAYRSGDIFPNSGHLRVTVRGGADARATVEYVRSLRPGDEKDGLKNGTIVHSYTVKPREGRRAGPTPKPAEQTDEQAKGRSEQPTQERAR